MNGTWNCIPEDTGVPLRVVSDLWGLKTMGTKELALRLDSLSLLKFNLQVGTIRLHDVMRAYLATKLANPEKLHGKLVDAWGAPHHLTEAYAWRWLSYHLLGAGRRDDLGNCFWTSTGSRKNWTAQMSRP